MTLHPLLVVTLAFQSLPPSTPPAPSHSPRGCRFGQALRYEPLATPSATLRVTLKSLRYVPSLHSKWLGAGFQPSPTLFIGYRLPIRIQFAVSGRHSGLGLLRLPTLRFGRPSISLRAVL